MSDARLTAVAVRRAELAPQLPPGCALYHDWHELVRTADVDAVVVATPPASHTAMVLAALAHGKPVFVEKPMAVTTDDADRIRDEATARRAVLHVDHIDLCNPAWRALLLELPSQGSIHHAEGEFGSSSLSEASTPPWSDWAPHPLALCITLLGAPVAVSARRLETHSKGDVGCELVEVRLKFGAGATAVLAVGAGFRERRRRLAVHTERCVLRYDDNAADKLVCEERGHRRVLDVPAGEPLRAALARFLSAARAGAPDHADAELGAQIARVLADTDAMVR
jgi:predicted dehydrogenase